MMDMKTAGYVHACWFNERSDPFLSPPDPMHVPGHLEMVKYLLCECPLTVSRLSDAEESCVEFE